MAGLAEEYALTQDAGFLGRVTQAVLRKAVAVATESGTEIKPNSRKQLAARVIQDPLGESQKLTFIIARDPTIAALAVISNANVTDTMITNALSDAVWNGYAAAFSPVI